MQEILEIINNNLENVMNRKTGRVDYTLGKNTKVKIYKCGKEVTRIDIVKKEDL